MACGFSVDLPKQSQPGDEVKESITVTVPKSEEARLTVSFGAGSYTLDFSGDLMRDGVVNVEAGAGDVQLIIPKGVHAAVMVDSAAVSINHSSGWEQDGNEYAQQGEGPELTIIVRMAAGNLTITD